MGARETALRVLMSCRNNHAWADAAPESPVGPGRPGGPEAAVQPIGLRRGPEPAVVGFLSQRVLLQKPDHLQPPLLDILHWAPIRSCI